MAAAPTVDVIDVCGLEDPTQRPAVLERIGRAGRDLGGFLVAAHGVPDDVVQEMYTATTGFFALSTLVKSESAAMPPSRYQGWCSPSLAVGSNTAETFAVSRFDSETDLALAGYRGDDAPPLNLWPPSFPRLRAAWRPYLSRMHELSLQILNAVAQLIDAPAGWVDQMFIHHASGMIANWYPDRTPAGGLHQQQHTDFGALTILFQDSGPGGLDVRDRTGAWHPVPPRRGTFVVLFGDLMQRWSDDRIRAVPHRVTAPQEAGGPRLSVPYFCHPHRDAPTTAVGDNVQTAPRAHELLRRREASH